MEHPFFKWILGGCYAAPPLADIAANAHPTWVTQAGLIIGVGGLICHIIQTALKLRQSQEALELPCRPRPPKPFVPRIAPSDN